MINFHDFAFFMLDFFVVCMLISFVADGERSSVGRAPVCGTGCRRFEPDRSPQV